MEHLLPSLGTVLGDFELREALGKGGFGAVYKAFQNKLHREVAVKVLMGKVSSAGSDELAQRFMREIDLVRRLEHPNIVRLYDYGQTDEGLLWMAMEIVRGTALNTLLKEEGAIEPERCRSITLQILSGLVEAHEHNIVHRDLKPSNIMLTRKGAQSDWVKLLDFGIGKAIGSSDSIAKQDLTATDAGGYGTPRYMAPEQIRNQELGPHTDLYAVGLIFYEMLVGRPAVSGETTFEILANQITADIVLPDWLARTEVGQIIRKAIDKDWKKRYPHALELYEALESVSFADLIIPIEIASETSSPTSDTSPSQEISLVSQQLPSTGPETPSAQHSLDALPEPADESSELEDLDTSAGPLALETPPPRRSTPLVIGLILVVLAMGGVIVMLLSQSPEDSSANAATQDTAEPPKTPETAAAKEQQPKAEETPPQVDLQPAIDAASGALAQAAIAALQGLPSEAEAPVEVVEAKTPKKKKKRKKSSAKTSVSVKTQPKGAKVYVNGKSQCKTPCTFELPRSGKKAKVVIKAKGYYDEDRTIDLSKAKQSLHGIVMVQGL